MQFIVCLGLVSLFADITYEGGRSITGPFLRDLGASAALVGFIAGLGEFMGFTLRLASGLLADRTRAYWTITILGYAVNLVAIPSLAFTTHWPAAALLIVAERAGKSLRAPARDVLLSDAAHKVGAGWGFGLHAAMDQTGAVIGPLFVAWEVARTHRFSTALLYLAIPAATALAALLMARGNAIPIDAPAHDAPQTQVLPRLFWIYVGAAGLLALGYVDFPLIAYHFGKTAVATRTGIPLLYAVAMAANGVTAPLFGRLYDRFGLGILSIGIVISAAALPLSFFGHIDAAILGLACWGAGMGAMDAILRSGISKLVAMNKRGRAFGLFNAVFGAMWLAGSTAMGLLYSRSILTLVVLGVGAQLAAAAVFFSLRNRFR
jgi:MFS-type transporter involved in bile tolerance (Atg22 family)